MMMMMIDQLRLLETPHPSASSASFRLEAGLDVRLEAAAVAERQPERREICLREHSQREHVDLLRLERRDVLSKIPVK